MSPLERFYRSFWKNKGDIYHICWDLTRWAPVAAQSLSCGTCLRKREVQDYMSMLCQSRAGPCQGSCKGESVCADFWMGACGLQRTSARSSCSWHSSTTAQVRIPVIWPYLKQGRPRRWNSERRSCCLAPDLLTSHAGVRLKCWFAPREHADKDGRLQCALASACLTPSCLFPSAPVADQRG